MTTDQIFYQFSEQIMRCHFEAARIGVQRPELRSVMTQKTKEQFLRHEVFQSTYSVKCDPPKEQCDFEFRGSFVSLVPGDDYYFHTRCTNLPEL